MSKLVPPTVFCSLDRLRPTIPRDAGRTGESVPSGPETLPVSAFAVPLRACVKPLSICSKHDVVAAHRACGGHTDATEKRCQTPAIVSPPRGPQDARQQARSRDLLGDLPRSVL